MKNIFDVNLSAEEQNYKKFIVKEIPEELQSKHDTMTDTLQTIQTNYIGPLWLNIVYYILAFLAVIMGTSLVVSIIKVGFSTAYQNAAWVFYVGGICIIAAVALFIYKRYKTKNIENDPAVQAKFDESTKLTDQSYEYLHIPADAEDIDVFSQITLIKRNKVKQLTSLYKYTNFVCKIFKDDYNLYIADTNMVCAFPLNSFTGIVTVNKNATFCNWNKEETFNKGIYKQFKIRCNNYGTFFVKPYFSVRLNAFKEEYEIVIPAYELQTFLKYINLNVK